MYKNVVDIFPTEFSSSLTRLTYPNHNFKFWEHNPGIKAFVLFANDENKIYYSKKRLDDYINSILQIGKGSKKMTNFKPKRISFHKLANRYMNDPEDPMRKNADTRLGFKLENTFLVKAFFTFGLRRVERGSAHIIQTLNVPIIIYIYPKKTEKMFRDYEKVFPFEELHSYDYSILTQSGVFRIPPGTRYVLLTTQKNYFSLDIVPEDMEIPFSYKDPVKKKILKLPGMYDRPVKTPHIEEIVLEEESSHSKPEQADFYTFFQSEPFHQPSADLSNQPLGEETIEAANTIPVNLNNNNNNNDNPQQNITYWLIPPVLEKSVEFVKLYQRLKNKEYGPVPQLKIPQTDCDSLQPLDLKMYKTSHQTVKGSTMINQVENRAGVVSSTTINCVDKNNVDSTETINNFVEMNHYAHENNETMDPTVHYVENNDTRLDHPQNTVCYENAEKNCLTDTVWDLPMDKLWNLPEDLELDMPEDKDLDLSMDREMESIIDEYLPYMD